MNRVALVCPVHGPKFGFFAHLVASFKVVRPDCDLYFVLSESERAALPRYQEHWNEAEYIFAPDVQPNPSVITYKKFVGLEHLREKGVYRGIAAIDADSEFLRSGFHDSFDRFESNMTVCGYPLEGLDRDPFHEVVEECCRYFARSPELEQYKTLYAWWNTLPWYVADHLPSFFQAVGYFRDKFAGHSWYAYDQILYHAWLSSEQKIGFDDRHILLEYPELMRTKDLDNFGSHKLDWVRHSARRMPIFGGQSPLMHFHTDRDE